MWRLNRCLAWRHFFEQVIRVERASGGIVGSLHHSQIRHPRSSRDVFSSGVSTAATYVSRRTSIATV